MQIDTRDFLNLRKPRNYVYFGLGIATESIAVLTLIAVPLIISAMAFWFWP